MATDLAPAWRLFGIFTLSLVSSMLLAGSLPAQESEASVPFAFEVASLNAGLPELDEPLRLDTPRAALDSFLEAIDQDQLERASHALNLAAIGTEEQSALGPNLALMLAFLLKRYDLIDWAEIPDQPDARVLPDAQGSAQPYSRRSVELGVLTLEGRPVPISLQRFRAEDGEPEWLFSPLAVEHADELYIASRPGLLSDWVPLRQRLRSLGRPSLAEWGIVAAVIVVSGIAWFVIHALLRRASRDARSGWRRSMRKTSVPAATLVAALLLRLGLGELILLTGPVASNLDIGSEILALVSGAWLLFRLVSDTTLALSTRYVVPLTHDDPENRRTKTSVFVVRRLMLVLIALLSAGYVLFKIGAFETFGLSVLASAGALSVVVAIAAQPLLGNMVAGLQIALTDPVRIGDVVVYNGTWSIVEDISFAHTVLRTASETRLIVPHSRLLSESFENWFKEDEGVRGVVKIPVDHAAPVDVIRREVERLAENERRLTEPPLTELVEIDSETAIIWIWLSTTDAQASWSLNNEIREKLARFVATYEEGRYLPHRRLRLHQDSGTG